MDRKELDTRFTFHPVQGNQGERYQRIREKAGELAALIVELSPESREQSLAVTACEEASMWANAAPRESRRVDEDDWSSREASRGRREGAGNTCFASSRLPLSWHTRLSVGEEVMRMAVSKSIRSASLT